MGGLFRIKRGSGKDNKRGFLEKKRESLWITFLWDGLKKGGLTGVKRCGMGLGSFKLLSGIFDRVLKNLDSKSM